jgi:hypothetical protein
MRAIKALLLFQSDKTNHFANLSRVDPTLLYWSQPNPAYGKHISFRGSTRPARLVIMGFCFEDKTREPYLVSNGAYQMKSLSLTPFSLEIERNVAVVGLLASEKNFKAQLVGSALTFATRLDATNCMLFILASSTITDGHLYSEQARTNFKEQADPCKSLLVGGNAFCSGRKLRIFFSSHR